MKDVKKVGFLGFGKSNSAIFKYLSENFKFETVIRDEGHSAPKNAPSDALLLLGDRCFEYAGEDVIFLSPSVRRERREIALLQELGAKLSSDAELFFSAEPKNVLALTGSDGKSTTAALAGRMLSLGKVRTEVCGNFGLPLTPLCEKNLTFVAELSSFTLRYLAPKTRRALITNVTPNHLNWHASFSEYIEAKENILRRADERVFSYDCPVTRNMLSRYGAFAVFSSDVPFCELKSLCNAEVYYTKDGDLLLRNDEAFAKLSDVKLRGMHNVKNVLAAAALVDELCERDAVREAVQSFTGLHHRAEFIGEFCGVRYYDSSIDSTPDRTRSTLAAFDGPLTLVLGGRDKGLSYEPLASAMREKVALAILTGENAEALGKFIASRGLAKEIVYVESFDEAVKTAAEHGLDTVLSPAATSYDRFSDFEKRGEAFALAVRNYYKNK